MSLFGQPLLDLHEELLVDVFCGGGGASSAIEQATGRMVDIAINHDAAAISMHEVNHPQTLHLQSDIFEIDPREATQGRPIGLFWASPDCTHHSKARGGKPLRTTKRRALAWVVTRWAGQVRPRVIMLENVEEFAQWGPLIGRPGELRPCPKRKGKTFRQWVKSLTDLGYVVEWRELRACDYGAPTIRRRLFLIARCDGRPIVWPEPTHGHPDSVSVKEGRLKKYRTAAECLDWNIPMCSIFASHEDAKQWGKDHGQAAPIRPLAENTCRRIARGVKRYVIDNPKPFIVNVANSKTTGRGPNMWPIDEPTRTVTSSNGFGVVAPIVAGVGGRAGCSPERPGDSLLGTITGKGDAAVVAPFLVPRYGEREGQEPRTRSVEEPAPAIVPDGNGGQLVAANLTTYYGGPGGAERGLLPDLPIPTQSTENRFGVVASFLAQNNGGFADGNSGDGHAVDEPASTLTGKCANQSLVGISLIKERGTSTDADPQDPLDTVSAGGTHHGVVAAHMTHANTGHTPNSGAGDPLHTIVSDGARHSVVGAFLDQANGGFENRVGRDIEEPVSTVLAHGQGHHGLVAAHVQREFGESVGSPADAPIGTVTPGGQGKAAIVASFLAQYNSTATGQKVDEPAHTIPTVDRFGCVTVTINGQTYVIEDIAMRMLQPKELYAAQGFRKGYIIDRGADGRRLTKTEQVRMCGNSVCPPVAEALVRANVADLIVRRAA